MNATIQALSLIQMIDRAGGPPAKHRARFERAREMVQQADSYGGDLGDLGAIPLLIPWLVWVGRGLGVVAGSAIGYGFFSSTGTITDAMKTVIWAGAAWTVWQMYKSR